ncbi:Uncharacterised protein [Bordetella pertussis]|nr:Uncharacterised protein [Bordetella pertussis]CFW45024.1 Uncharacterised protein [Bordetella pertussis]
MRYSRQCGTWTKPSGNGPYCAARSGWPAAASVAIDDP